MIFGGSFQPQLFYDAMKNIKKELNISLPIFL